jgi:hypothetical protein
MDGWRVWGVWATQGGAEGARCGVVQVGGRALCCLLVCFGGTSWPPPRPLRPPPPAPLRQMVTLVKHVIAVMERIAPLRLAEKWDRVRLSGTTRGGQF